MIKHIKRWCNFGCILYFLFFSISFFWLWFLFLFFFFQFDCWWVNRIENLYIASTEDKCSARRIINRSQLRTFYGNETSVGLIYRLWFEFDCIAENKNQVCNSNLVIWAKKLVYMSIWDVRKMCLTILFNISEWEMLGSAPHGLHWIIM